MKKQLLSIILALMPMLAMADDSGSCGTNVTWTYNSTTKTLTIQGSGAMTNYNSSSDIPWKSYKNNIQTFIVENGVTNIGRYACLNCYNLSSVTIPNNVTSIEGSAFQNCSGLTSITIPNSVTSIGSDAFSGCSGLTSVTIPNGVTSIGAEVFYGCTGLTSITIPNSVTSIGSGAFHCCTGLTSIDIPNSVISINSDSFNYCLGLTSIVIPNSVTNIGYSAFEGCSNLNSVTIGNNVNSIGSKAFKSCTALTSIIIPNSVTSIGSEAFFNCKGLTSVTIGNSVTSIENYAFSDCSGLTSVNIPNSVLSVKEGAFSGCRGLISATIGKRVTSIEREAFYYCTKLTSVTSKIECPFACGSEAFYGISSSCILTVPYGRSNDYIVAGWTTSKFKGGVVENDNVAIAMETGSGAPRTMIGYSSQYNLDFTGINDVKAYLAIGFTDTKSVLMARVYVVPANTGIVLKSDVAGVEVEVPTTTSDVYYANLLKPAVNNVTIYPTEDIDAVNYTNLMVGKLANEQMGFVTLPSSKAYSNKCYLQIPTAFYESATLARDGGMEMVFVDDETTDIRSLMHQGSATNDAYYDLQGRKVTTVKKGIYIKNGKKVIVK